MPYGVPLSADARNVHAVAIEDRYPIAEILRQTPDIPDNCQWAIFARNHDERRWMMVTDKEPRLHVQDVRAGTANAHQVGIRRRLHRC